MKKSLITGGSNFEELYCFRDFPVYMGCTDQHQSLDIFHDMKFEICKDSGIIQINDLPPLDQIYLANHNDGVGATWERHNSSFCHFVSKFGDAGLVLEIGGANGLIAKEFVSKYSCDHWRIVDLNPLFAGNGKISVVRGLFDQNYVPDIRPNTVVHSNALEHSLDPMSFLKNTWNTLPVGGKSFVSIPNLKFFLENGFANSLNFEHNIFLSDDIAEYFMVKAGFRIVEKFEYSGGWIFYCLEKQKEPTYCEFSNKYEEYKDIFDKYISSNKEKVDRINHQMEKFDGQIYLFGAHIFSLLLLNLGLNRDKIVCILDDSKIKNKKRLYGTDLFCEFPSVLVDKKDVAVVLNVGQHKSDVVKKIFELNQYTRIIE